MRIRDVMTKNPVTVSSDALVFDARKIMKEKNFRRLPVVDKGKLLGIVTLQDINEAVPPQRILRAPMNTLPSIRK